MEVLIVPNFKHVVDQCKLTYPRQWSQAHTGSPETDDFIKLVAAEIHALDPRFGLNGKRGNVIDISDDALCFKGEGADYIIDENGVRVPASVIDVIAGAGGPNPSPAWGVVSDANNPIRTAWVKPGTAVGIPAPPTMTIPSYAEMGDDAYWRDNIGKPLAYDMAPFGGLNDGSSVWFSRAIYRCMAAYIKNGDHRDSPTIIKSVRNEWRARLHLPPIP